MFNVSYLEFNHLSNSLQLFLNIEQYKAPINISTPCTWKIMYKNNKQQCGCQNVKTNNKFYLNVCVHFSPQLLTDSPEKPSCFYFAHSVVKRTHARNFPFGTTWHRTTIKRPPTPHTNQSPSFGKYICMCRYLYLSYV